MKDDVELRDVLKEWTAPETPRSLDARVLRPVRAWWRPLVFGYLKVPVPVACCLAIGIAIGAWSLGRQMPLGCSPTAVHAAHVAPDTTSCAPNSRC